MINKIFLLTLTFFLVGKAGAEPRCRRTVSRGESHRSDCTVKLPSGEKNLVVLELNGDFPALSEAHGYLLAPELEAKDGLLAQMADEEERELSKGPVGEQVVKRSLIRTFSLMMSTDSGEDFKQGLDRFFAGYLARLEELGLKPSRTRADVQTSGVGVELWNVAHGVREKFKFGAPLKLGCTAFTAPGIEKGEWIHARSLDSDLIESWGKYPVIYLVRSPGKFAYVAAGSAGMIYPGGISGFNEKKISVSLHSLYPMGLYEHEAGRPAAIAPLLQQKILEGADSIEAAVAIARSVKHFSSWALLVFDAKTEESASIEVSKSKVRVVRSERGRPWAQTNHFRHPEMREESVSPTFKKDIETRTRLKTIETHLASLEKGATVDWAIERLSDHRVEMSGPLRSFGETIPKVINVMGTVTVPDKGQLWLTLGDRVPASHGHYVGVNVDWNKGRWQMAEEIRRNSVYDAKFHNWQSSLSEYVLAHLAYRQKNVKEARAKIQSAIALAGKDNIDDISYRYIRARLAHLDGDLAGAQRDWEWLEKQPTSDFQQGLISLYFALTLRQRGADPVAYGAKFESAVRLFKKAERAYFKHPQLSRLIQMAENPAGEMDQNRLFEINFETVE